MVASSRYIRRNNTQTPFAPTTTPPPPSYFRYSARTSTLTPVSLPPTSDYYDLIDSTDFKNQEVQYRQSSMPSPGFPPTSGGDVEIRFSNTDEVWVLSSALLKPHSPWFRASMSDRWKTGHESTILGGNTYWVYELRFETGSDSGILVRNTPAAATTNTNTEMIEGSKHKLPKTASTDEKELHDKRLQCLRTHQDLLGAFYFQRPKNIGESFESAVSSVQALYQLAMMYGCEIIVETHVESALGAYKEEIIEQCSTLPVDMLELATTVKSKWIFIEATTNLLGRSKRVYDGAQARLQDLNIADMMDDKRSAFEMKLRQCEFDLFTLQARDDGVDWRIHQAINFFRQWLTEKLTEGQGSGLAPGYAKLYRTIATTQSRSRLAPRTKDFKTYLNKMHSPITDEGLDQFESEVKQVFERAAVVLQPILEDNTRQQSNKKKEAFRSLTFMSIEEDEIPWLKA